MSDRATAPATVAAPDPWSADTKQRWDGPDRQGASSYAPETMKTDVTATLDPTTIPDRSAKTGRLAAVKAQIGVAVGQGLAGLGNMVFGLIAVRLLAPQAFASLTTFLALYLALSLPGNGLSALAALYPDRLDRVRRNVTYVGLGLGVAVACTSPLLSTALHLPVALLLCLAAASPLTPLLAMARGRLYGWGRHGRVVASLVTEPAVRLTAGLALADAIGAGGGGIGVVAAGVAALEVARRARPAAHARGPAHARRSRKTVATIDEVAPGTAAIAAAAMAEPASAAPAEEPALAGVSTEQPDSRPALAIRPLIVTTAAFLLLGIAQNLDLLMANRLLGTAAPAYAALSTLGGVAAFATATVPLVLLPQAHRSEHQALPVALAVAGGIGLLAVAVVVPDPHLVVRLLLGARYETIAPLLGFYLAAMACFGIARVLAAHNLAVNRGVPAVVLVGLALVGQAVAIVAVPHRVEDVALTTLATMGSLTVAEGALALSTSSVWRSALAAARTPVGLAVTVTSLAGVALRLYIPRGIWLDEATSIFEARLPYMRMISQLYNHDVHPPLYFSLLWVDIRVFGSDQLGVRALSILFGALIAPVVYIAGRDLFDKRTGLVASVFAVVAPLMVWYSQEARMYSMFMFFALVAVWAQAMAIRKGNARYWAIWALASAALGWTEYFGLFQVVVQQLIFVGIIVRRRHHPSVRPLAKAWLVSTGAMVALLVPLAPFCLHQFMVNQSAGKGIGAPSQVGAGASGAISGVNVYSVLANVLWAAVGYHSNAIMAALGALWPLGILSSLLVLGRRHRPETKLVVACAVGPLALDVALATFKPSLLDVRYISGLAPLLVLLAARVVTGCAKRRLTVALCCGLVTCGLAVGLFDQQLNGSNPRRYDFQRAIQTVDRTYRPGDLLVYDPPDLAQVVSYYAPTDHKEALPSDHLVPPAHGTLFVLDSQSLMTKQGERYKVYELVHHLTREDHLIKQIVLPNVDVWEFRR